MNINTNPTYLHYDVLHRAQLKEVRREVEALMERPHPNIVLLMGVSLKPPAVITELCEIGSLHKVLARVSRMRQAVGEGCAGGNCPPPPKSPSPFTVTLPTCSC